MLSWLPYSLRPPISCVPLLLSTNWAIQWNTNQNIASWVTDLGPVTVRSLTLNAHASLKMSSKETLLFCWLYLFETSIWYHHGIKQVSPGRGWGIPAACSGLLMGGRTFAWVAAATERTPHRTLLHGQGSRNFLTTLLPEWAVPECVLLLDFEIFF